MIQIIRYPQGRGRAQLCQNDFSSLLKKESTLKGTYLPPIGVASFSEGTMGTNSFLLKYIPFQKRLGMEGRKQEVTKVVTLVKTAVILPSVSSPLNSPNLFGYQGICVNRVTKCQTVQTMIKCFFQSCLSEMCKCHTAAQSEVTDNLTWLIKAFSTSLQMYLIQSKHDMADLQRVNSISELPRRSKL